MAVVDKIVSMPDAAGVYLMKEKSGKVIYIGKAKSLKRRLSSYLARSLSTKTAVLMSQVYDIDYQICANESFALLLEASLVRKYKPKYNVSLRDDKSFPSIKITREDFPAIYITRRRQNDGAKYLGPYTNVKLLKEALKVIRRNFPYRSCAKLPKKACIYYRLKLSPAPCIGKINKARYGKTITNIRLILEGKTSTLIKKLSEEMNLKSKELKFEEAAKIRDQINALSAITEGQSGRFASCELEDLRSLLKLNRLPLRIEAFDISNIVGKDAAGSMVNFYKGLPNKNDYRRFRIKTVTRVDDYDMLREVIRRRYLRAIKEHLPLPDLILIDGGKGHLLTADNEIRKLGIKIPLISIAKDKENIYLKNKRQPLKLDRDTPALNLIRRIRDEAHRFAVSYHRILRRKKIIGK